MDAIARVPALNRDDRALLVRVRATVQVIEPHATVILYGSRARGDAAADSDWDLLVLLDGQIQPERRRRIHHRLYDIEIDTGAILSPLVLSHQEWDSSLGRSTSLHASVEREGLLL